MLAERGHKPRHYKSKKIKVNKIKVRVDFPFGNRQESNLLHIVFRTIVLPNELRSNVLFQYHLFLSNLGKYFWNEPIRLWLNDKCAEAYIDNRLRIKILQPQNAKFIKQNAPPQYLTVLDRKQQENEDFFRKKEKIRKKEK